jgi:predicted DNA-binding protein
MGTTEHPDFLNVQVPDEVRERMDALSARTKSMAADIDAIREEYTELEDWEDALENAFEIQSGRTLDRNRQAGQTSHRRQVRNSGESRTDAESQRDRLGLHGLQHSRAGCGKQAPGRSGTDVPEWASRTRHRRGRQGAASVLAGDVSGQIAGPGPQSDRRARTLSERWGVAPVWISDVWEPQRRVVAPSAAQPEKPKDTTPAAVEAPGVVSRVGLDAPGSSARLNDPRPVTASSRQKVRRSMPVRRSTDGEATGSSRTGFTSKIVTPSPRCRSQVSRSRSRSAQSSRPAPGGSWSLIHGRCGSELMPGSIGAARGDIEG